MIQWLKDVFSSESCASFARSATAVTVATACGCLIYLVHKNHALPEATSLVALGAWMTAPYAVNKATAAWAQGDKPDHHDPPHS